MIAPPLNFLQLSTEVSEPFIIPNVSPVSSPKLMAKKWQYSISEALSNNRTNDSSRMSPLVVGVEEKNEEEELIPARKFSTIDLNETGTAP
ncbi:hypothetical protein KGF56_001123 [Candida oxycetoniae]|uniref:Uncharacterized protein n=1 Tax=Candida oxycetoniae TaxID=497107 RepID=A0AAI9WZC1_9ASCO|nr:uncharacterized protein KGF56_001123 [Candida oxycetoniae]KAI3405904.1 hypothetical protein KGF56_001123 [Candida oxycetoniae]